MRAAAVVSVFVGLLFEPGTVVMKRIASPSSSSAGICLLVLICSMHAGAILTCQLPWYLQVRVHVGAASMQQQAYLGNRVVC